jgi:2,4-dienoyl-CoA reductase-like NADH-dependent reductase (Old Yellow Enzyme family)
MLMERFNRDEFDLVAVGRSLLNDPEWTRKLRRGDPHLPYDQLKVDVLY